MPTPEHQPHPGPSVPNWWPSQKQRIEEVNLQIIQEIRDRIEVLINREPSGEIRNHITEANIQIGIATGKMRERKRQRDEENPSVKKS